MTPISLSLSRSIRVDPSISVIGAAPFSKAASFAPFAEPAGSDNCGAHSIKSVNEPRSPSRTPLPTLLVCRLTCITSRTLLMPNSMSPTTSTPLSLLAFVTSTSSYPWLRERALPDIQIRRIHGLYECLKLLSCGIVCLFRKVLIRWDGFCTIVGQSTSSKVF